MVKQLSCSLPLPDHLTGLWLSRAADSVKFCGLVAASSGPRFVVICWIFVYTCLPKWPKSLVVLSR